jgi:DNA-directed RNA polymerase subunit L
MLGFAIYDMHLKYTILNNEIDKTQRANANSLEENKKLLNETDRKLQRIEMEKEELELEIKRLKKENTNLLNAKILKQRKEKFVNYKTNHKIFDEEYYPTINIPPDFSSFFSILIVKKGDTYQLLLNRAFGSR